MAGLLKVALALHHRTIPPSLHFHAPNPRIAFDDLGLAVVTEVLPWRARNGDDLCAGVNSFGFGGTNAHAVLTSAPVRIRSPVTVTTAPYVWTVSARSPDALREAANRDALYLRTADAPIGETSAVVQRRRSHHPHRLAIVANDEREIAQRLADWVQSGNRDTLSGYARDIDKGPVFVFSGQGSQWPGMGCDLIDENEIVRATIERFDALMQPAWGRALTEVLHRDDDAIFDAGIGQPAFFALQVAIARLLEHWGIRPGCVIGHSLGEVAAAHVAGALSDSAAAHLVVQRSKAQQRHSGRVADGGGRACGERGALTAHAARRARPCGRDQLAHASDARRRSRRDRGARNFAGRARTLRARLAAALRFSHAGDESGARRVCRVDRRGAAHADDGVVSIGRHWQRPARRGARCALLVAQPARAGAVRGSGARSHHARAWHVHRDRAASVTRPLHRRRARCSRGARPRGRDAEAQ